jgi:uncharacterized protein YecT (DUF1311 family)
LRERRVGCYATLMWKRLTIGLGGLLLAFSGHASQPDPFAYEFVMTPEEGPVDAAVERRYTASFNRCQKGAVTTAANVACFHDEFSRQDLTLNRVWRTAFARMPANSRGRLRAAQRQWVSQRDPFCKSKAAEFSGGTIAPVVYLDCRVEQTIRRTMWLSALLERNDSFPPIAAAY